LKRISPVPEIANPFSFRAFILPEQARSQDVAEKLTMPLFVAGHGYGPFGTNEGADAAAFAVIVIDFNVAGLLVSRDAQVRAKISAQVAAAAEIVSKAPARLHHRCLFIKPRFDLIRIFGLLLLGPALDFQFTWFSHPAFLYLTTEAPLFPLCLCGESLFF
jgi:hypothetical protein